MFKLRFASFSKQEKREKFPKPIHANALPDKDGARTHLAQLIMRTDRETPRPFLLKVRKNVF